MPVCYEGKKEENVEVFLNNVEEFSYVAGWTETETKLNLNLSAKGAPKIWLQSNQDTRYSDHKKRFLKRFSGVNKVIKAIGNINKLRYDGTCCIQSF